MQHRRGRYAAIRRNDLLYLERRLQARVFYQRCVHVHWRFLRDGPVSGSYDAGQSLTSQVLEVSHSMDRRRIVHEKRVYQLPLQPLRHWLCCSVLEWLFCICCYYHCWLAAGDECVQPLRWRNGRFPCALDRSGCRGDQSC